MQQFESFQLNARGSTRGIGAPLLNDYKLEFFWKRFPQTLLGGLKLKLGYEAPFYVYLFQVLVFLVPFVLGGLFTIFVEFHIVTDLYVNSYIYGSLMVLFVLVTQLFSWLIRRGSSNLAKFQKNILAQDDEVDFVSCCGFETVQFLFPKKKFTINVFIHAIISGVLCGVMFLYLLPSTLNGLFGNTGATAVVFVFGWFVVCVGQYSLTSAPGAELALFRALDSFEITPLMRPFYVLIFGIIGILSRNYPEIVVVDKVLHILFPFLPLLWIVGVLPPLDVVFSWLAEQVLVLVLGGSAMATDIRLFVMFVLSSLVVVVVIFITHSTVIVIITAACVGFVLSLDIFGFVLQLRVKLNSLCTKKPMTQWRLKEVIIFIVMFFLTGVIAGVSSHFSSSADTHIFQSFCFVFLVLLVSLKVLGDVQSVSIFFGLFRNPLFPASIESARIFHKRKKNLTYVGILHQALHVYVSPLLQVAFLAMFLIPVQSTTITKFALAVGTVRAFRQAWQNSFNSLLELSVVCLSKIALGSDAAVWWNSAGLGLQLMLVGVCRDRIQQLLDKIVFMVILTVTSWKLPKQRHNATLPILVTSAILLPVVIAVLCTSTLLAAPLLPLFCLPIFLIGFPRPLRSWPSAASTAAVICEDSIYYEQLIPQVTASLSEAIAKGSLGNPLPGDHFLARFQDRLIWAHVLESGYKFVTLVLKGLELQETSCHTVEATSVDDVFQEVFVHEGKWPLVSVNTHATNVLKPRDVLVLNNYSDAKNVLTGIIDQPENLKRNSENFFKTLVWVLVNYCKDHEFNIDESNTKQTSTTGNLKKQETLTPIENLVAFKPNNSVKETVFEDQFTQETFELQPSSKSTQEDQQQQLTSMFSAKRQRSSSLPSLSGSVWSQESLKLDESVTSLGKSKDSKRVSGLPVHDEDIDDLDGSLNLGGFPAVDISQSKAATSQGAHSLINKQVSSVVSTFVNNSTNFGTSSKVWPAAFTSEHAHKLDLPLRWKSFIPVDKNHLESLFSKFPDHWFTHVVGCLHSGPDNKAIAQSILSDTALVSIYKQLICACYALIEVLGLPGSSAAAAGPVHVHKVYSGDLPWSINIDWLNKDVELKALVLKAYRYAFKLTYDEAVLGEVTSDDELMEYMTEYDRDWYLGADTDRDWQLSVQGGKPYLFSLGRDKSKGSYTSRVLTKQEIMAPVGRLNGECVRGQWASLVLELLYFTNDDEERYSIQAHPTLLRNLTIQAADPPLGYPVYSSGTVTAPLDLL